MSSKFESTGEDLNSLIDKNDDGRSVVSDLTESRDSLTTFLFRTYDSAVSGVCWLMYGLHHDTSVPTWLSVSCILVETLQWLSFGFFKRATFHWDDSWTGRFASALDYASNFMGQSQAGFVVACGWVGMIILLAVVAVYAQKRLRWVWPMRLFRLWLVLGISFMFLPVAGALLRMVLGCLHTGGTHYFYPELKCWESTAIIYGSVAAVITPFFVFTCCIVAMTFFELNPNQREDAGDRIAATARSSARGDLLNVAGRTVLLVCFIAFSAFDSCQWPLAVLLLAVGCALVYYQIVYMPYYNLTVQTFVLFQALVVTWSGICVIITNITVGNDRGAVYLLYFCVPFLFVVAAIAIRARVDQILYWTNERLTAPYLVELKARMFMMDGMHKASLDEAWVDHTDEHSNSIRKSLWREVEAIFQLGVQRFPDDPLLHLAFAAFYLFYTYNKPLAYRELASAKGVPHAFDVHFVLFLYQTRAELETSWGHSSDVQSYIEFKERKSVADNASRLAARSMFDFWTELLRSTPNVGRLIRLGNLGRAAIAQAQTNFERLLQINAVSVPVLRAYGGFMIDFHGDLATSTQLLNRADELEDTRATMVSADLAGMSFLDQQASSLDIFDERNSVAGMSVEKDHFASIISLNAACRRMFGYTMNSELLGRNISCIIPEPIQSMHDDIVREFLSRNQTSIMNTTRVVLALHKNGFIFPINLFIRWADTSASKVIGVMSNLQTQDEQMMFDRENGACITYVMQNVYTWFGFTREMLTAREIYLGSLFPHLSTEHATTGKDKRRREMLFHKALSRTGVIVAARHHITGRLFLLKVWMTCVLVRNREVSFIRMSKNVNAETLAGEENVLHFTEADLAGEGALEHDTDYMFSVMADGRRLGAAGMSAAATAAANRKRAARNNRRNRRGVGVPGSEGADDKYAGGDDASDNEDVAHLSYGEQKSRRSGGSGTGRRGGGGKGSRRRQDSSSDSHSGSDSVDVSDISGSDDDRRSRRRGGRRGGSSRGRHGSDSNSRSGSDSDSDPDAVRSMSTASDSDDSDSGSARRSRGSRRSNTKDRRRSRGNDSGSDSPTASDATRATDSESDDERGSRPVGNNNERSAKGNLALLRAQGTRGKLAASRGNLNDDELAAQGAARATSANKAVAAPTAAGAGAKKPEGTAAKTKAQQRLETSAALTMAYAKKSTNRRVRNALASLRKDGGNASASANASGTDGNASAGELRGLGEKMAMGESDRDSHVAESIAGSDGSQLSGALSAASSMVGNESSVNTAGHRLITTFINDETKALKRKLNRISWVAFAVCVIIFGCWLAMFLVTSSGMADNKVGFRLLRLASHRRSIAFTITSNTRILELIRLGVYGTTYEAFARADLVDNASLLDYMETVLYDDSRLSSSAQDFFYVPSVQLYSLVGGVTIQRVYNLKEVGQVFLAAAARVGITAIASINQMSDSSTFFILVNGPYAVLDAFTRGALAYKDGLDNVYQSVWSIEIVTYGIALLVLVFFIFAVLRPTVSEVEEGSSNVLRLLLALPRPVVRLLQRRFLQALRNQGDDEEEDEDVGSTTKEKSADYADDVSDADSSISAMSGDSEGGGAPLKMLGQSGDTDGSSSISKDVIVVSQSRMASLISMHTHAMRVLYGKYAFLVLYCLVYTIVAVIFTDRFFSENKIVSTSLIGAANRMVSTQQMIFFTLESLINPRVTPLPTPNIMPGLPDLQPIVGGNSVNAKPQALYEPFESDAELAAALASASNSANLSKSKSNSATAGAYLSASASIADIESSDLSLEAKTAAVTASLLNDAPEYVPARESARRIMAIFTEEEQASLSATGRASLAKIAAIAEAPETDLEVAAREAVAQAIAVVAATSKPTTAATAAAADRMTYNNMRRRREDEDGSVTDSAVDAASLPLAPSSLNGRVPVAHTPSSATAPLRLDGATAPGSVRATVAPGSKNDSNNLRNKKTNLVQPFENLVLARSPDGRTLNLGPRAPSIGGNGTSVGPAAETIFEEVKMNPGNYATDLAQKYYFESLAYARGLVYGSRELGLSGQVSP